MRIWDIEPEHLCRQHLLGEHRELHGLWNILTRHGGQGGYSRHPETRRWRGRLAALYARHESLVREMELRGYKHRSPLEKRLAVGDSKQDEFLQKRREQREILRGKSCSCFRAGKVHPGRSD